MNDEVIRLQAAIAAIHNHLHAGNVNAAHEACECAINGAQVTQPNLTLSDSARIGRFATRFNELVTEYDMRAAFLALVPSATVPGAFSFQVGGEVTACKLLEQQLFSKRSTYQGEHK